MLVRMTKRLEKDVRCTLSRLEEIDFPFCFVMDGARLKDGRKEGVRVGIGDLLLLICLRL